MELLVDPGEREGLFRLAAAVLREGIGDDRFVASDGFETWCLLAGADPTMIRCGIRQALAGPARAGGGGEPLRLYHPRPAIERLSTATDGR